MSVARSGADDAITAEIIRSALNTYHGKIVNQALAESLGFTSV